MTNLMSFLKVVTILVAILMTSMANAAIKNPLIRQCLISGGDYIVAQSQNDQIGLCQFGKASIGALETLLFSTNDSILKSVKLYMRGQTNCAPEGQVKPLTVLGGATIQYCQYPDNSWIDIETLQKGQSSSDNNKLNEFLGL